MPRSPADNSNIARRITFTLNNPVTAPGTDLTTIPYVRYAIYQLEKGEEGTRHFQGYLEMTQAVRWSHFRGTSLQGAHFERAKGDQHSNIVYCSKEEGKIEGPWEFGEKENGGQGSRNDIGLIAKDVLADIPLAEIAKRSPEGWIKWHKGIRDLRETACPIAPRDPRIATEAIFIYGPPGVGKTKKAHEIAGPEAHWQDNGKWWDGYEFNEWVVLDDFAGSSMAYKDFKRIVDRYPCRVEYKGGTKQMVTTKFVITSCRRPIEWWNMDKVGVDTNEIYRRISKCYSWDANLGDFAEISINDI